MLTVLTEQTAVTGSGSAAGLGSGIRGPAQESRRCERLPAETWTCPWHQGTGSPAKAHAAVWCRALFLTTAPTHPNYLELFIIQRFCWRQAPRFPKGNCFYTYKWKKGRMLASVWWNSIYDFFSAWPTFLLYLFVFICVSFSIAASLSPLAGTEWWETQILRKQILSWTIRTRSACISEPELALFDLASPLSFLRRASWNDSLFSVCLHHYLCFITRGPSCCCSRSKRCAAWTYPHLVQHSPLRFTPMAFSCVIITAILSLAGLLCS